MISKVMELAIAAGLEIMQVYSRDFAVEYKDDSSPLTLADTNAHRVIEKGLMAIAADIPIISEEGRLIPYEERRHYERFWLVDPLDGTKEFIKRNGEFTVNIALIEGGRPVAGVIYAPALGLSYFAAKGKGAFRTKDGRTGPIRVSDYRNDVLKVAASRSHRGELLEHFLKESGDSRCVSVGSSLKFCLVAEGSAHIYPRFGHTMEWDTAAGQAILEEAGGAVVGVSGRPLSYNKPDLVNPFFMALGSPPFPWEGFIG